MHPLCARRKQPTSADKATRRSTEDGFHSMRLLVWFSECDFSPPHPWATSLIRLVYRLRRMPQSIIVTSTMMPATATATHSLGRRIHQRPRMPQISIHGPATADAAANNVPPLFALSDCPMLPRTKCAHDVVIPHDGQRMPTMAVNEHGCKPNWVCVPYPFGEGVRNIATINNTISPRPNNTKSPRKYHGQRYEREACSAGVGSIGARDEGGRLATVTSGSKVALL